MLQKFFKRGQGRQPQWGKGGEAPSPTPPEAVTSEAKTIHRDVVCALELIQNAECALNDAGGEEIMNNLMLLEMLFINALYAFERYSICDSFSTLSLDDVFGNGLSIEEYDEQCDENDEFDELDWDEFFSYEE